MNIKKNKNLSHCSDLLQVILSSKLKRLQVMGKLNTPEAQLEETASPFKVYQQLCLGNVCIGGDG